MRKQGGRRWRRITNAARQFILACKHRINPRPRMMRRQVTRARMSKAMTIEITSPALASMEDNTEAAAKDEAANVTAAFALVIDDQISICQLVVAALTEVGMECAAYQTAKPALASLDQRRPQIIFLDVALDNSDAIDVLKGLSEKRYAGIVQLMSGGRLHLLEAVQRIGNRYGIALRPPLQKPVKRDDIRNVLVQAGFSVPAPLSTSAAPAG